MKQLTVYFTCLFFTFIASTGQSQTGNQVLRGTIKDHISESPIPGAKITVLQSDPVLRTLSDVDGVFKIPSVPIGRHDILITYSGYEDVILKGVSLEAGKEKVLVVVMVEKILQQEEVTVSAKKNGPINEMSVVSTQTFSVEETQKYAAAVNDPARMATSFAGVVSTEGVNNDISIRGNSPRGLIWRMEGVEIPNPNHFAGAGTSGGGISIISSQLLGNSDFSTGAFASEYGNALSGVFDLSLRKGNNEKREYTFQAGVLGIDAALEGPFKKGYAGSYLINYRYSTLGLLAYVVPMGDEVTTFQDLSFNVFLPTKKAGNFGVFGFGGLSSAVYEAELDTTVWIDEPDRQYEGTFASNTGMVGAWHKGRVGENGFIKTNLAFSGVTNVDFGDSLDVLFNKHRAYDSEYIQSRYTVSSVYTQKLSSKINFKTGIVFNQIGFKFSHRDVQSDVVAFKIDQNGSTNTLQAYFQMTYRFTEKMTLNVGAHYLQLFLNNTNSVEPRAALSYKVTPRQSVSLGYGMHSQIQPLGSYFARVENDLGAVVQPNKNLKLSKAHHGVLSYNWTVNENNRLKVELYYQHLYNVPIGASSDSTFSILNTSDGFMTTALSSDGLGRNYGMEITLDRSLKNNFYYLIAASLYESKYQALNGKWYDTRYNTNYTLSITGGKEWVLRNTEKRRTFGVNVKSVLAGGMRYTEYDLTDLDESGYPRLNNENSFGTAMPVYYRFDLKLSLKRDYKKVTGTLAIDLQNVLNIKNVGGQYFDTKTNEVKYWYNPGILPILSYRLTF